MYLQNLFGLQGRNVLVTGATGHLGRQMSIGMAEAGAHVLVNGRNSEKVLRLVEEIAGSGGSAEPCVCDVSEPGEVAKFADAFQRKVNVVVSNAHGGRLGTIETASREDFDAAWRASVVASRNLATSFLGHLKQAVAADGDASFINVASMYGVVSPDLRIYDDAAATNPPFYGAAKAGLIQFTRYAANEFGPAGVRFNSISPGPFPSPTVVSSNPEFIEKLDLKTSLGRVGRADEIVGVVVFLASSASTFVTGANIAIDGGWTSM